MLSKINRTMIIIHALITFLLYIMCVRTQHECDTLYLVVKSLNSMIVEKARYDAVAYENMEFAIFEAKNTAEAAYSKAQIVIDNREREIK